MSGFSAQWLALREPYDLRARDPRIIEAMVAAFRGQASISVVDLACGRGATLRAISSYLPRRQDWRLVDNDLGLLAAAAALGRPPDVTVAARAIDLVRDLELALDGPIDLITTSALLDLVSEEWLERLVEEAAVRRLPVYAALTYNGDVNFDPIDPVDAAIVAAFNGHQRSNKGFGPALGPEAGLKAAEAFRRIGYSFAEGPSDWVLRPSEKPIQAEVIRGLAQAAGELDALAAPRISDWRDRRLALVEEGRSSLRVGHVDFFALPLPIR
jgi:hypothetical protein